MTQDRQQRRVMIFFLFFFKKHADGFTFNQKAQTPQPPHPLPSPFLLFVFFSLQTTLSACSKQASIDRAD